MNSKAIESIHKHLQQPQSYIVIMDGLVYLKIIDDPLSFNTSYLFEDVKNYFQPYLSKYDINNYKGDIHCSFNVEDNLLSFYYKNIKIIEYHDNKRDTIQSRVRLFAIYVKLLSRDEDKISQLSFEFKDKDILNQLAEFCKFYCLDPEKSYLWARTNFDK